jgi:saccharopine dehydrogenase-like NADP-dependent oxidoreductase
MTHVLLLGAGKIGRMIAHLLVNSGDYSVRVADVDAELLHRLREQLPIETIVIDATRRDSIVAAVEGSSHVISALSFRFNPLIAEVCLQLGASYYDLTEDVETTRAVRRFAAEARPGQVFVPQCGLAPGFVGIIAMHLTQWFDKLDSVHMRVGALPQFPTNQFKYNLTWSTDGLINEYCNPCEAIINGEQLNVLPLEGVEQFELDGMKYEAFNTSGGLGTMCETLHGKVRELNYKTIRYLGHRDLAQFLVNELLLRDRRELLRDILERSVPITYQDVVIVFCTVKGWRNGRYVQKSDVRKIYDQVVAGETWSAIQYTTAGAVCGVLDLTREGKLPSRGFVRQEDIPYEAFIANRFGQHYQPFLRTDLQRGTHDGSSPS